MADFRLLLSGTAALAAMFSGAAMPQGAADFPSKPVVVIVPIAAGGPIDIETRLHTKKMSEIMPQPFIVDYKPGAGTTLGAAFVARATPDGYTLLTVTGGFTIFPAFYANLSFDTLKDFAPVALMSERTSVLLASPSFAPRSLPEYIAYARANPGRINYGTTGVGSAGHLGGEWLHGLSNTKATFIPYKGAAPEMIDLAAGRIDVASTTLLTALPLIKSGKVRALAILNNKRSSLLPNVPTIAEQGLPDYNYISWLGFSAPAGTPAVIVNKLSEGFARAARSPEVVAALEADGSNAVGSTPAQLRQLIVTETTRWKKVVQDTGIKLEE